MKENFFSTQKDDELIRKIQNGETADRCFAEIYKRYHGKVIDKCHSLVKNKKLAEELAEDIFSKVYEKLSSFRFMSSFSSWLYSITYNQCIDYLREKKKLHYPDWNRENEIPEIIDEDEENLNQINYENLLKVLEMIHPEEKALIFMKYQENLSMKLISKALRITEDAAKMRLKRARTRIVFLYRQNFMFGK